MAQKRTINEIAGGAAASGRGRGSQEDGTSPSSAPTDLNSHLDMWRRPSTPSIDPQKDSIVFMQIDVDYYTHAPHERLKYKKAELMAANDEVAVLRMFGVTKSGNSVLAHIHGFFPYFFVQAPKGLHDANELMVALENRLQGAATGADKRMRKRVLAVEVMKKESLMHYTGQGASDFFRVTVALPKMVATCRGIIERGLTVKGHRMPEVSYETNVPFALRFMIDTDVSGGNWCEAVAGKYFMRPPSQHMSSCQIEVDLWYSDLTSHKAEGDWMHLAPLRVLSFDIECVKAVGQGFPQAEEDPVIQIAAVLKEQGQDEPLCKVLFSLHTCAPIAGAAVFSYEDEAEMLSDFQKFLVHTDPDLLTGYNIINFDIPYLLTRCKAIRCSSEALVYGRLRNVQARIRDTSFSSAAHGTRESKDINTEGRVQFDVIVAVQREYKLRSYSLNAVSAHFLKEQKEDVHYSMIGDLFRGNPETRKRVGVYCLKDAYLPIRLFDRLLFMYNYVEMARVTGTPLSFLLTRGQQIKVVSQLYRKCKGMGFVIPTVQKQATEDKYEGATVLDPKKGFYAEPIATLDFASLYPSIMMAHNLCYCTLVPRHMVKDFEKERVTTTPTGDTFVKASERKGVLPLILEELLSARKHAKADMKTAQDELTKSVLNGRQLALKISANSVYGFTGAQVGQLACLEISSSVTSFGREMIEATKKRVEEIYTRQNGYEHDADVIYGDTDSVMVRFGTQKIDEAMRLGLDAAGKITDTFLKPIKLEFEKVYCPFLLMNKKRYAGLLYTRPEEHDKVDFKGIETVRRDNCALVQTLVDGVLRRILIEQDLEGAKNMVKQTVSDLLQNKVDLSELVISKSLGKGASSEDYAAKLAHVELAERMRKRDPKSAPAIGDRVAYVMIKGLKGAAGYEKAEDPLYVLQHNLAIDAQHYIDHQLKQPLQRIFEPIMNKPDALFGGDHTKKVAVLTSKTGALAKFVTKQLTCLGCKVPLKDGGALCPHCRDGKQQQIVRQRLAALREHERTYRSLWVECQRCQGSLHQDILCQSRDCPIFYRRTKAKNDIENVQEAMDRLRLEW
uniref:DNA polymerase n=1 Tax=Chromera velia CCMP2878 TaxID=1169474 RepID=A0A0G4I0X9_9ALVE|eukprot:Cvel_10034.t1-p1 / transcript=Cvel_10034.t1 / gene=Cvel_10034 / organism=Chromera_velia_CCMP2878 / gene_product=DNA polymerase delta catalytic subunit, putative / transcript_product=DNA polymerase delta catalytic subunit, putative / location=Cvel_scaffold596:57618-76687(+) / protein_length=1070 / sequence_SO=supercontig / SO=protein_coding / is_pseudo=false